MGVYESILKGLNEAVDYEKGIGSARVTKCTVNPAPEQINLSVLQEDF